MHCAPWMMSQCGTHWRRVKAIALTSIYAVVTVNFDCNMNEPTTSEEATKDCDSQNNEVIWTCPTTSEEDNVSTENDYDIILQ